MLMSCKVTVMIKFMMSPQLDHQSLVIEGVVHVLIIELDFETC